MFVSALILISDSLDTVISFLRMEGDLETVSSIRWIGIVGMWELFVASPFQGLGFGSADNRFPVNPSNVFYFGLLAGFVPYLIFEFDVLRVSVNYQLFFFCWGVIVFCSIKAGANASHKNEM